MGLGHVIASTGANGNRPPTSRTSRHGVNDSVACDQTVAISDDVDTPLSPQLVSLLAGGRISLPRVLLALLRRPALLKEFRRLGRDTRVASTQLGKALGELLTLTLEW